MKVISTLVSFGNLATEKNTLENIHEWRRVIDARRHLEIALATA